MAGALPIVLTRAGRERPPIADTVEAFVAAARTCKARLRVIDAPHGRHGFDMIDHTIPAAGLVRGWVLQGLAAEREGSVEQVVEALSRDVARLRRQLTGRQAS
jgi:hypothetical protein